MRILFFAAINLEESNVLITVYPHIGKLIQFEVYTDDAIYVVPEGENATYGSRNDFLETYHINVEAEKISEIEQENDDASALEIKEGIQSGNPANSEYEAYINDLVAVYGIEDAGKCYFCFKDDNVVIVVMDDLYKIQEVHAIKIIED